MRTFSLKIIFALHFTLVIVICVFIFILSSCNRQVDNPGVGPGDIEPPHYTQESELIDYLADMKSENEIDCYYKTAQVPDNLTFAFIRPQNIYIGWYYHYLDNTGDYSYFTWTADKNGQDRLDFDIGNENLRKIEDTGYYYSIVQNEDWPDIKSICTLEWVEDGYNFHLNIPVSYVLIADELNIDAIMKYTQLEKVLI